MITFYLVSGLIASAALAWMLTQVRRRPGDLRLHALTGLIVLWVVSAPFGVAGNGQLQLGGLDRLDARLVEYLLRIAAAYCLVLFFLITVGTKPRRNRAVLLHAVPPIAVGAGMAVAASSVPAELRGATAALATASGTGPTGVAGAALFYLLGNLYFAFAFGVALVWVHRYRPAARGPLRRGLTITEVGLVFLVVSTGLFIVSNLVRWWGSVPPSLLGVVGVMLLLPGIAAFLVGVLVPGVLLRLSLFRVWREHRRVYHELRPLWQALHDVFPENSMASPSPGSLRDCLAIGFVHRRHYRRVVECRDGLVRLSPYLPADGLDEPTREHLRQALEAARRGEAPPSEAAVLARPAGERFVDDVDSLLRLSRRLQPRSGDPEPAEAPRPR